MADCFDQTETEIDRIRCPDCMRDYSILKLTHTHGMQFTCQRPQTRYKEVYIRSNADKDVPSASCAECTQDARRRAIPKRTICDKCGYEGNFHRSARGWCQTCEVPQVPRGRASILPAYIAATAQTSNEPEYNTIGRPAGVSLTPAVQSAPPQSTSVPPPVKSQVYVQFVYADFVVAVTAYDAAGDTIEIHKGPITDAMCATISGFLRKMQSQYNVKIVRPHIDDHTYIKFMTKYLAADIPEKYFIEF